MYVARTNKTAEHSRMDEEIRTALRPILERTYADWNAPPEYCRGSARRPRHAMPSGEKLPGAAKIFAPAPSENCLPRCGKTSAGCGGCAPKRSSRAPEAYHPEPSKHLHKHEARTL